MPNINSISKNKIKEIVKLHQKKYRDLNGLFIAEGFKTLEEIISANIQISEIFAIKDTLKKDVNVPITIIDEETMKKISTTSSVCDILTIARKKETDINNFKNLNKIILIDSVNDPGNLGTIIRSAAAFGIEGIILFGNCTDLYSSKVIRSAAGNFFKIPIILMENSNDLSLYFKNHLKIATCLRKSNNISLDKIKQIPQYIIMFGSEAKGLSSELIETADKNIKLDMKNNVESLNLAVTVSIVLYEISK